MNCENCTNKHNGKFGSGRFCSSKCARGFSTKNKRDEINKKISLTLKLKGPKLELKNCKECDKLFQPRATVRVFCSNRCRRANKKITPEGVHPVVDYRVRIKRKAIEYKGGCCVVCGYKKSSRSLQFHHRDPTQKDFGIGGKSLSWEKIKNELEKCELVCGNCHGEIHDGLIDLNIILDERRRSTGANIVP